MINMLIGDRWVKCLETKTKTYIFVDVDYMYEVSRELSERNPDSKAIILEDTIINKILAHFSLL